MDKLIAAFDEISPKLKKLLDENKLKRDLKGEPITNIFKIKIISSMRKKAIVILSAGIIRNRKSEWANTDLSEQDNKLGAPGGKQRVIAASYLYKIKPDYF